MPLYDYRCRKCGETFEVKQKFSDSLLTVHEACGGEVDRLISAPALQFKGSGWYITDYARGGGKSSSSDHTKADSKTDAPKTDSKPESKTESKPAPAKSSTE